MTLVDSTLTALALLVASPGEDMIAADPTFAAAERRLAAGDPDGAIVSHEKGRALLPAVPGYDPRAPRCC